MKILITGITGFVGHYLRPLLEGYGHEVWGMVTPEEAVQLPQIVRADLRDRLAVEKALLEVNPSAVVHLAAQSHVASSWGNPEISFEINTLGTLHLLEACRRMPFPPRILHVSTAEVHGQVKPENIPLDEHAPLNPVSPYAVSKTSAELLAHQYFIGYHLPVIRVRPFNHTGPGRPPTFALSDWARRLACVSLGKHDPVLEVGNLEVRRDYLDVRDVVNAYRLLLENGTPGETYVLGRGEGYWLKDLLRQVVEISGQTVEYRVDTKRLRPADVPLLVANPAKIKQETGWEPRITIEQTLEDLYDWWLEKCRAE
ncbi:MAG: GDP-mannose 4,6-dehydratase [Acidobacteriota bacterium]